MQAARLIALVLALASGGARAEYWPRIDWAARVADETFTQRLDVAFAPAVPAELGGVRAVVVVQGGQIIGERYRAGFDAHSRFLSWSVAKSFVHALTGILVREGKLALDAPLPVPEWQQDRADPRRTITLDNALRMSTGLAFVEDYEDLRGSDAIRMLFGDGAGDIGHYAADKPLLNAPGTHWYYSSGTTNIVSRVVRDTVGGSEENYRAFLSDELFGPLGIDDAIAEFDGSGTLIGSSLLFMSARSYARLGLLYLRDGVWDGRRILPEGWVSHARTPTPGSDGAYGAHWWLRFTDPSRAVRATRRLPADAFMARGYQEQAIVVVPSRDLVVVCLSMINEQDISVLQDYVAGIVDAVPVAASGGTR